MPTRCPCCGSHIAWLTRARDFVVDQVDLWRVLRGQRQANLAFLLIAALGCILAATSVWVPAPDLTVLLIATLVLFVLHFMLLNGFHQVSAGFAVDGRGSLGLAALATIPGISVAAIVLLNWRAWRYAGRIRLPFCWFGYSEQALLDAFARAFCRQCGYNLTGNVSGFCPECGTSISELCAELQSTLAPDHETRTM